MGPVLRASRSARLVLAAFLVALVLLPIGPNHAGAATALSRLAASGSATGGKLITIRVELSGPAPSGGATVQMSSTSALIPVPTTFLVPAGKSQQTIQV